MTISPDRLPIRLWWGYRRPDVARSDFLRKLGRVFMPQTIYTMHTRLQALAAYLPVVPPSTTDSVLSGMPEELAVVVYKSIADYERANATLEGRAYQDLHGALFTKASSSQGFPERFAGEVVANQPYFVGGGGNWQKGHVNFLLGKRPRAVGEDHFFQQLTATLAAHNTIVGKAGGPDTVLLRTDGVFVSYFELWSGDSTPSAVASSKVKSLLAPNWSAPAAPVSTPSDLNTAGNWLHLNGNGEVLNFTF